MIQNEWNGRTRVCPLVCCKWERGWRGVQTIENERINERARKSLFFFSFFENKKEKGKISLCWWWMGAIQLHTCDKQEMRPDISRWHGEDRWVSRWQQQPPSLSRSLDILSLPFEQPSRSGQTESEPPSALIENATINRSFDDGHTTFLFFSLSLSVFF